MFERFGNTTNYAQSGFGDLVVAEGKCCFELIPPLRRQFLADGISAGWFAKKLLDELLLKAVECSEFRQEEGVNNIVVFRTFQTSKRVRRTPAQDACDGHHGQRTTSWIEPPFGQ